MTAQVSLPRKHGDATTPQAERPGLLRLEHLDGLRGVAALYVTLFHAAVGFNDRELPMVVRAFLRLFSFGHEAVAVFIVLSGYCLMLPAARAADGKLRHGFGKYIGRRAFRILPPYYIAFALSLLLIWLVPALNTGGTGTIWDDSLPAFEAGPIITHLAVVHNWFPEWGYRVNGPLWSVASEWQIYFLLPLVLLPAWRRGGLVLLLATGAFIGYLPVPFYPAGAASANSWYVLLFAMGMAAAAIGFAKGPTERWSAHRIPWRLVALGAWGACAVGGLFLARYWFRYKEVTDPLVGFATAALLIHLGDCVVARRPSWTVVALRHPRIHQLGQISYSLYLSHLPVVAGVFFGARALGLGPVASLVALVGVGVPSSLGVGFVFHKLVERRFIPK